MLRNLLVIPKIIPKDIILMMDMEERRMVKRDGLDLDELMSGEPF